MIMRRIERVVADNKCVGCGSCVAACPSHSIGMVTVQGFWYPQIDSTTCINCGKCSKACAIDNNEQLFNLPQAYFAAYAKNEYMPPASTSGGLCAILSRKFLELGHFVVAAKFFEGWQLQHDWASKSTIGEFDGSKYMQSLISADMYESIKNYLKQGQSVLFIGTPCQVSGIITYMNLENINRDKLYTVDFMCHGVPSPILGKAYINWLEKQSEKTIEYYNFRSKKHGWGKMYRTVSFKGGKEDTVICNSCALHSWFGKHLSVRKSCFQCQYRRRERVSDITVADFWGISKYYPEISTKQGVSAVQINSEKGQKLYDEIESKCESSAVSEDSIWKDRKTALGNFLMPQKYDDFWDIATKETIDKLIQLFPPETKMDRMRQRIRRLLRR